MSKKRRTKTKSQAAGDIKSMAIKVSIGSAAEMILFFALTAAAAFVLWKRDSGTEIFKYIMLVIGAVSAFAGGFAAVRPIRKNGIALGALTALPSYFIIILISTIVGKSGIGIIGWIVLGVMVLFSAVGGIVAVNKRK